MTMKLAVLASGSGSNLQSIFQHVDAGRIDAKVCVVFSNNPEAYALERARAQGVPAVGLFHRDFHSREAFDAAMVDVLHSHSVDAVALAGFMRMLTPTFLDAFPMRVVNIHPAILPSFPGAHGQRDAAQFGVKLAGCTVHFVDEEMDHGPIIIQAAIPVAKAVEGDALARAILRLEHRIFPQALAWLAADRLRVEDRFVIVENSQEPCCFEDECGPALVSPPLEPGF